MKKLNLHHFHIMEIDKQQQSMLNGGGIDYCICAGPGCGCMCDAARSESLSDSYSKNYYKDSGGDINHNATDNKLLP